MSTPRWGALTICVSSSSASRAWRRFRSASSSKFYHTAPHLPARCANGETLLRRIMGIVTGRRHLPTSPACWGLFFRSLRRLDDFFDLGDDLRVVCGCGRRRRRLRLGLRLGWLGHDAPDAASIILTLYPVQYPSVYSAPWPAGSHSSPRLASANPRLHSAECVQGARCGVRKSLVILFSVESGSALTGRHNLPADNLASRHRRQARPGTAHNPAAPGTPTHLPMRWP